MNRAQRRAALKENEPLLDLVERMTLHAVFENGTGKPITGPLLAARAVVARSPFRSVLSKVWPPTIRDLWALDLDGGAPPLELLNDLAATIRGGGAVLLVARDRATRDRCKRILSGWV